MKSNMFIGFDQKIYYIQRDQSNFGPVTNRWIKEITLDGLKCMIKDHIVCGASKHQIEAIQEKINHILSRSHRKINNIIL